MTYIPSTTKIQYGIEDAYHDDKIDSIEPVGITNFRCDPKVELYQIPDLQGDTFVHDSMIKRRWSEGTIEGLMDFERFWVYLDGFFGYQADVPPRTYLGSPDWVDEVPKSLAIAYGQPGAMYQVSGVIPYSLGMVFQDGEPVMYKYDFFAGAIKDTSVTFETVGVDVPVWAHTHQTELWIDPLVTGTPGTTPIQDIAFRAEINFACNRRPVWHFGDQVWDSIVSGKWANTMKLVLEADAVNLAHLGDILDATADSPFFNIQIRTTNATQTNDIWFCGVPSKVPTLITDADGIVTVELDLVSQFNSTVGSCVKIINTVDPS